MGHGQMLQTSPDFSFEVLHMEVCVSIWPNTVAHILCVETTGSGQAGCNIEKAETKLQVKFTS